MIFDNYNFGIANNCYGKQRVIGYKNNLDYSEVKRYNKKFNLIVTLNPINKRTLKGIRLNEIGYHDKWSRNRKAVEQFVIVLNQRQARKLIKQLKEKAGIKA